jgi:ankyrin repeat protein
MNSELSNIPIHDLQLLKPLLKQKPWLFHTHVEYEWPLLHRCMMLGTVDVELLEMYIKKGGDVNRKTSGGESLLFLLHFSGQFGDKRHLDALLRTAGATMSAYEEAVVVMRHGDSKLPVTEKVIDIVSRNLSLVHWRGINGYSLMHWAARYHNAEIVKYLLDHGADINVLSHDQCTPLGMTSNRSDVGIALYDMLREYGAKRTENEEVNAKIRWGTDADIDWVINWFIDHPTQLHAWSPPPSRNPWLHIAVRYVQAKMVVFLLDAGVNVNAQDDDGETALHVACDQCEENTHIVEMLIARGADLEVRDSRGQTPLHAAVRYLECVEILLKAGSDVNAVDNDGYTPIDIAQKCRWLSYRDVRKLLKSYGGRSTLIKLKS